MTDGKPQPKPIVVVPMVRPETIRDLVRRLVRDAANVSWSRHALERMEERGITDRVAIEVLRCGSNKGPWKEAKTPVSGN